MATIPCPDCKKNVSENADTCPKCGAPITPEYVIEAKAKQKKTASGCLIFFLIVFALGFIGKNCSSDKDVNTASVQTAPVTAQANVPDYPILGMDATAFADDFDANAAELGLTVTNSKFSKGSAANTITAKVGCCAYLIIALTKDTAAKVKDVSMTIGGGDGTAKSGAEVVLAMDSVIMTVDPDQTAEFRGGILRELGLTSGKLPEESEAYRGNHKYWFKVLPSVGMMFGVEAIN